MATFFFLFLVIAASHLQNVASSIGINYGQVADNLPPPDRVTALLNSVNLTKVRIYDTNPLILRAFANSGIDLIVTLENEKLVALAADPEEAVQWVSDRIRPYYPATRISGIAVGNEIYKGDGDTTLIAVLLSTMSNIRAALTQLGIAQYIQVSTPHSLAVLASSYPSSAGAFRPEIGPYMVQFLQFLADTGAPFWINAYPYFAYKSSPDKVSLDYALSSRAPSTSSAVMDPYTKLKYDSMMYAQVDAVVFAMYRLGFEGIEVGVSETGWPSSGDPDEAGATVQNAAAYNMNLLRRQAAKEGTPLRPRAKLEVYLFALFNEDLKPGPASERNYGLYKPDETMVYNVGLSTHSSTGTTTSTAGSSASTSFSSSATTIVKAVTEKRYKTIICWPFVHFLTFQVLTAGRTLSL